MKSRNPKPMFATFENVQIGDVVGPADGDRLPKRVVSKTENHIVLHRISPVREVCGYSPSRFNEMQFIFLPDPERNLTPQDGAQK